MQNYKANYAKLQKVNLYNKQELSIYPYVAKQNICVMAIQQSVGSKRLKYTV